MLVEIIGLGYVGLPTAVLLASNGHKVIGVDINQRLLQSVQNRSYHIEDDILEKMFKKIDQDSFYVTDKVLDADVFIVAVPTPVKDKKMDFTHLESACINISKVLKNGDLVIIESTITPGTTSGIVKYWLEQSGLQAGKDFSLAHVPERVQPGNLYKELTENDRIVGGIDQLSSNRAKNIYESFVLSNIEITDSVTAETAKVMENTYRDINIAIANEFLILCEKVGANPWEAINLANRNPRVNILKPGPGVGGHCIPVDPWFLVEKAPEDSFLIQAARRRNDYMPRKVVEDIKQILDVISGKHVSLLGCTYKADTSDDRESPAKSIVRYLEEESFSFNIYDPNVNRNWPNLKQSIKDSISECDLIVLLVPHKEFLKITPEELRDVTSCRTIYDCTGSLSSDIWKNEGFNLVTIGDLKQFIN
ncbi:nucleotide sugar dehydrogenase [Brevibacillus reuszeri]|uniref:nucleotide sugar dehydrogenase n=1 Tax=Brevibacillus reuszeri TaxID=54915 RepID=UPI003D1D8991